MVCQNCGASLADNVKFCRECGAKVEKKIRFCRECGASVKDGAKFCIECGSKLKLEINNHEVVVRTLPEEHLLEEHNINVDFSVDTNSMGLYQENIRKEESLVKE